MVQYWQPGIQYNIGDVVEYSGAQYNIIEPHRSQSDWTPPVTPALWGRIPDEARIPRDAAPTYAEGGGEKNWNQHTEQQVDVPHEEKKKHWYDLDDKRKKELEIGGGLVLGLAALGGGYYAYHHHEKSEEKKKAAVWSLQAWLAESEERTAHFRRDGPRGPVTWVLVSEGGRIPDEAYITGEEGGNRLYSLRAFCDGGLQIGKAGYHLSRGGCYGYESKSYDISTYEVLFVDERAIKWVRTRGRLDINSLGAKPIEGGKEHDGTFVAVVRADHNGLQPGRASEKLDGAYIAYGSEEVRVEEYEVLCYA